MAKTHASMALRPLQQIVWAKTRAVGCAVAKCPRRGIWVCNYDPPGNVAIDLSDREEAVCAS
jgi:hypothetical protein